MHIALKEANESEYWIKLLWKGEYIDKEIYIKLNKYITEIIVMLVKIIKTSKENE